MDSVYNSLRSIISNAKKSLNRPYSENTIAEKKLELEELTERFNEFTSENKVSVEEISEFDRLKLEAAKILNSHIAKNQNNSRINLAVTMSNMEIGELTTIVKLIPFFFGEKGRIAQFHNKFRYSL